VSVQILKGLSRDYILGREIRLTKKVGNLNGNTFSISLKISIFLLMKRISVSLFMIQLAEVWN
jgi:hypothetical protein